MAPSVGSISTRLYIAWLPDSPSEPTLTIVLTSPQRRFVDVRILKPGSGQNEQDHDKESTSTQSSDRLDWAIGGVSASSTQDDGSGNQVIHSEWHHWVDSRTAVTEGVVDQGDVFPNSDDTVLEKGSMVNPATGLETQYEELWRDTEPQHVPGLGSLCVVLQYEGGGTDRGMVMLLGTHCQGLLRVGDDVTVERWEWKGEVGHEWTLVDKIGKHDMPCSKLVAEASRIRKGAVLMVAERAWKAVEVAQG